MPERFFTIFQTPRGGSRFKACRFGPAQTGPKGEESAGGTIALLDKVHYK
jgi:hypothetical protein